MAIQGGTNISTNYASTTASGSAAAFSLFPPTPTSWMLTDSAHDQQLQISVASNTIRNLTLTITRPTTGATLATGALDQSGTGTITYSDGSVAVITKLDPIGLMGDGCARSGGIPGRLGLTARSDEL